MDWKPEIQGSLLFIARTTAGLSREQLGATIESPANSILEWESGTSIPSDLFQEALVRMFGLDALQSRELLARPGIPSVPGQLASTPTNDRVIASNHRMSLSGRPQPNDAKWWEHVLVVAVGALIAAPLIWFVGLEEFKRVLLGPVGIIFGAIAVLIAIILLFAAFILSLESLHPLAIIFKYFMFLVLGAAAIFVLVRFVKWAWYYSG
jgi:hypothetical protein